MCEYEMQLPETVELETGANPLGSVIWLHGLGADGHDFEPIVPELRLPDSMPLRFVFPHAPVRPVTVNGGMAMRAWYDIRSMSMSRDQDMDGIRKAAGQVEALIAAEQEKGVPANKILLAGFSQGGAMALYIGLRHPQQLAGICALSAYLLLPEKLESERSNANRNTPVFMAHGIQDPVVPIIAGESAARQLSAMHYPLKWETYDMQHNVCMEEILAVSGWIKDLIEDA